MRTSSLTDDLTVEFGDAVPPTLIASTVRAAVGAAADDDAVEQTARADVEALAEAVRRSAAARDATAEERG